MNPKDIDRTGFPWLPAPKRESAPTAGESTGGHSTSSGGTAGAAAADPAAAQTQSPLPVAPAAGRCATAVGQNATATEPNATVAARWGGASVRREPIAATALVVAKSPIAGFAKTRLTPPFSPVEAAYLAACALLDTLEAVRDSGIQYPMVAWTGDIDRAERRIEIASALKGFTVVPQRGNGFGKRLANAHADAARFGLPVLQIGMDTPQASPRLLAESAARLVETGEAVLGPAADGGWWALGLSDPRPARLLTEVPMSTDRTGELTANVVRRCGFQVHELPELTDVDTYADLLAVAAVAHGRFARTALDLCSAEAAGHPVKTAVSL